MIDTATNRVIDQDRRARPGGHCRVAARRPRRDDTRPVTGAATFAVTLSPDGRTLYAVNSGANSIAVIPLDGRARKHGQRPDPDRLRAARHHLQRRRLVRCTSSTARASPARTPATWPAPRPASPSIMYPGGNAAAAAAAQGRRTSTSSSSSARRWSARRCRDPRSSSDLTEQGRRRTTSTTARREQRPADDGVPRATTSSTSSTSSRRTAPSIRSWAT